MKSLTGFVCWFNVSFGYNLDTLTNTSGYGNFIIFLQFLIFEKKRKQKITCYKNYLQSYNMETKGFDVRQAVECPQLPIEVFSSCNDNNHK